MTNVAVSKNIVKMRWKPKTELGSPTGVRGSTYF